MLKSQRLKKLGSKQRLVLLLYGQLLTNHLTSFNLIAFICKIQAITSPNYYKGFMKSNHLKCVLKLSSLALLHWCPASGFLVATPD